MRFRNFPRIWRKRREIAVMMQRKRSKNLSEISHTKNVKDPSSNVSVPSLSELTSYLIPFGVSTMPERSGDLGRPIDVLV